MHEVVDVLENTSLTLVGGVQEMGPRGDTDSWQKLIDRIIGLKTDENLDFSVLDTVFENHRKSLIQQYERSEQCLHFEWIKVD